MATELQNIQQATEIYSASETDSQINGSLSNALLSGGVSWDTGLTFDVTPLSYRIDGVVYNTAATQVTLATADPTNDRIDVIAGNTSSAVVVITGTPSADPVKPEVDLAMEIEVTFIKVSAGATIPDIVVENLYLEDAGTPGEWDATTNSPARIDLNSTNDPYAGTTSIEGTLVVSNDRIDLAKGSSYNLNTTSVLELRIKLKATAGVNDRIRLRMRNSSSNVGVNVDIRDGRYGFNRTNTADYQAISIPISDFKAGTEIDALRITANNIGTNIGFFLDQIRIIEGFGISVGVDAGDVTYTPGEPSDWSIVPANVEAALDELAATAGSSGWYPTAISLGSSVQSGATLALASGAGYYIIFASSSDDEILLNIGLSRNGSNYDGSALQIELNWMVFGATGGGDNVKWELDYYFGIDGSDSYSGTDGTVTNDVDVSARTSQIQYTDVLPSISGTAGDTHLQLTIRRNGTGPGSDSYSGDAEIYGINLLKV